MLPLVTFWSEKTFIVFIVDNHYVCVSLAYEQNEMGGILVWNLHGKNVMSPILVNVSISERAIVLKHCITQDSVARLIYPA